MIDWIRAKFGRRTKKAEVPASDLLDFSGFLTVADAFLEKWVPERGDLSIEEFDTSSLEETFHVVDFTTLHLAFLMYKVVIAENIPLDRVCHFWRIGEAGGGDKKLANLLARLGKLLPAFSETEALRLLDTGAVGDRTEIRLLRPPFNTPSMVIKLLRVVVSLRDTKV